MQLKEYDTGCLVGTPAKFRHKLASTISPTFRDQLWTNDGQYLAAEPGTEYPPDLDEYPEYGIGWMNEECIRIDMQHRLIPKPPLRPALKRSSTSSNSSGGLPVIRPDGRMVYSSSTIRDV